MDIPCNFRNPRMHDEFFRFSLTKVFLVLLLLRVVLVNTIISGLSIYLFVQNFFAYKVYTKSELNANKALSTNQTSCQFLN